MKRFYLLLFFACVIFLTGCGEDYSSPEIKDIVNKYGNTVVLIQTQTSQGSGVIINNNGQIVTNRHVIDNAKSGFVKLTNGSYFPIEAVLAKDDNLDLAIVKIDANDLNAAKISSTGTSQVGETIIAIGNPLGLENTVTEGIISSLERDVNGTKMLQISAPISPGNSGGGLFNLQGELIGITTSSIQEDGAQNLNFAIPIGYAIAMMNNNQPIYRFEKTIQVPEDIIFDDNSTVKKNPILPFLDNIIIRIVAFCVVSFIFWLICWLFFKASIQKNVSPIIAFSGWGATWMISVILAAFIIFIDLSYPQNTGFIESFSHIPIPYYFILLGLILIVIILIRQVKTQKN